ncbi:MAG: DUF2304 domain-containing protein [Gemmataceae bacterium]
MNPFQWIAVPILFLILLFEVFNFLRRPGQRVQRFFRCLVWTAAAVTIAHPDYLQTLATSVGITRGADLVFYVFVLVFIVVSFYFYARYLRMERQLTQVVRHLAIHEARKGKTAD